MNKDIWYYDKAQRMFVKPRGVMELDATMPLSEEALWHDLALFVNNSPDVIGTPRRAPEVFGLIDIDPDDLTIRIINTDTALLIKLSGPIIGRFSYPGETMPTKGRVEVMRVKIEVKYGEDKEKEQCPEGYPHPYWITSSDDSSYFIVAYAESIEQIHEYWDDVIDVNVMNEGLTEYKFSDRFRYWIESS